MDIQSAFNSSLAGLTSQGQAIAVVSDNVSNANTTGFKQNRVNFDDLVSEGTSGSEETISSDANVGSGSNVAQVQTIFSDGDTDVTGRALDVAINGNGFLVTGTATDQNYTRAGDLTVDQNGFLTTEDGQQVLGTQNGTLGPINMTAFSQGATPTGKVTIAGNVNASVATVAAAPTTPQDASFFTTATTYDSLGTPHTIDVAMTKTGVNTWAAQAYIDGGDVGGTAGTPTLLGSTTLTFGSNGAIADADKAGAVITAAPAYSDGASAGSFTVDLSGFTQFSAESETASISQDGVGSGTAESYSIGKDGTITAQLSSGSNVTVGQIQLASVTNVDGLQRIGNNSYVATADAGKITTGAPGQNGTGTLQSGALENSTVDLAGQFVNLILYQRGYQANSQALNVASEIEQQTIQLMK